MRAGTRHCGAHEGECLAREIGGGKRKQGLHHPGGGGGVPKVPHVAHIGGPHITDFVVSVAPDDHFHFMPLPLCIMDWPLVTKHTLVGLSTPE